MDPAIRVSCVEVSFRRGLDTRGSIRGDVRCTAVELSFPNIFPKTRGRRNLINSPTETAAVKSFRDVRASSLDRSSSPDSFGQNGTNRGGTNASSPLIFVLCDRILVTRTGNERDFAFPLPSSNRSRSPRYRFHLSLFSIFRCKGVIRLPLRRMT